MDTLLAASQYEAALRAAETSDASADERAEMLMQIGMGMQARPKSPQQLRDAVSLYQRALDLCSADNAILAARIRARMGAAWQAMPDGGTEALHRGRACLEDALAILATQGEAAEVADAEIQLGLVLQDLSGYGQARIQDAIQAYHRALQTFTREDYPQEYAVVHNNLAVAYLAIPVSDEHGRMREALAVQSFEEVLRVVTLVDHPVEYAMVQNNLGNALQYAASSHPLENLLRAIEAYDEALKVRTARDTPLEYANTIANKANAVRNLPDADDAPGDGKENLRRARAMYVEAHALFVTHGDHGKAVLMRDAIEDLEGEIGTAGDGTSGTASRP